MFLNISLFAVENVMNGITSMHSNLRKEVVIPVN